jgi:hypothetical protein
LERQTALLGKREFAAIAVENALMSSMRTRAGKGAQLVFAIYLMAVSIGVANAQQAGAQFFDATPMLRPPNDIPSVPPDVAPPLAPASPSSSMPAMPKGPTLQSLPPPASAGLPRAAPTLAPTQGALALSARFGRDLPLINGGLHWRVFRIGQDGIPHVVKEEKSSAPTFVLPPGAYIVNVGFGLASATKTVQLHAEPVKEVFEIPAGGLRFEGRVGDTRISHGHISFELYKGSQFEAGDKRPIASAIMPDDVVLVPEGTYYVVSNYGDVNSTVRSDLHVAAGKLTDVTVNHHAATVTLKLVDERGGEARANTLWSVLTPGGDVVKESIGAFPRVILAEGEYRVIARNDNKTYEGSFRVVNGVDGEVEIVGH